MPSLDDDRIANREAAMRLAEAERLREAATADGLRAQCTGAVRALAVEFIDKAAKCGFQPERVAHISWGEHEERPAGLFRKATREWVRRELLMPGWAFSLPSRRGESIFVGANGGLCSVSLQYGDHTDRVKSYSPGDSDPAEIEEVMLTRLAHFRIHGQKDVLSPWVLDLSSIGIHDVSAEAELLRREASR